MTELVVDTVLANLGRSSEKPLDCICVAANRNMNLAIRKAPNHATEAEFHGHATTLRRALDAYLSANSPHPTSRTAAVVRAA